MSKRSKKLPVIFFPGRSELVDAAVQDAGGDFRRIPNDVLRDILYAFAPDEMHELIRLLDAARLRNNSPQVNPLNHLSIELFVDGIRSTIRPTGWGINKILEKVGGYETACIGAYRVKQTARGDVVEFRLSFD